ncbi:MAG: membrane protein insertase YidC, partial [Rhizobiales bacterium]|nr:membrane protein insertase YidC [Hyphomicrobiales bacterium]
MSQRPDDQRNLLIAVALSMAVMLGWQLFYAGPQIKAQQEKAQREKAVEAPKPDSSTTTTPAPATPGAVVGQSVQPAQTISATPTGTREEALAKSARVPIATPSLTGSISLAGGRIDDVVLVNYRETVDPKSPNVVLLSPLGGPHAYFAEFGWQGAPGGQTALPDSETQWQAEPNAKLTPETPVTLTWDNGQGLKFKRTLSIDPNYMIAITDE